MPGWPQEARLKNDFRSVPNPRIVLRDQFGDDGSAFFVFGPYLEFSGIISRKVRNIHAEAAILGNIRSFPNRDGCDNTGIESQELPRPRHHIFRLQHKIHVVNPIEPNQRARNRDVLYWLADKSVGRVIRARQRKIESLDRAARSVEQRLDSRRLASFDDRPDDIRRDPGAGAESSRRNLAR